MRRGDWELALSAWFAECERRSYAYGAHDCALFAAGAVRAMTGADPAEPFRGRYCSAWSGEELLEELGFANLEELIDAQFSDVPVSFAQRGDLAWHDGSVGVVAGRFALFVGEVDGAARLIRVPRAQWQKAWRVD
ncbi:MAG: hypothetical protein J0I69_02710 [Altererythrobacter sp.]|nr:hypothetical protein [Altererythrobacter sp.]OJU60931.1 MAG: hypothetical protein BGO08_12460 [Altererythrobacter sp. 66-12]